MAGESERDIRGHPSFSYWCKGAKETDQVTKIVRMAWVFIGKEVCVWGSLWNTWFSRKLEMDYNRIHDVISLVFWC